MFEIDFLSNILNNKFLVDENPLLMCEPEDGLHDAQVVLIEDKLNKLTNLHLYNFSDEEHKGGNLLPFFNQEYINLPHAPKGLNKFCDYVLLLACDGIPYIFLFELKRGTKEDAHKQLGASKTFMDFIIATANRIKAENNHDDFDSNKIRFRRIIIKEEVSNKHITKPNELDTRLFNTCLTCKCKDKFNPVPYCCGTV